MNKRYVLPIVIILIAIVAMEGLKSLKKPPEVKPVIDLTPKVKVHAIELHDHALQIPSYGELTPKYQTNLIAQVEGIVISLSPVFNKGGFVKAGEVLALIDPSDYQTNLLEAEANLASAEASLEEEKAQGKVAEAEWLQIEDLTPSELALRKPQLARSAAQVKAAQAIVKRAKRNLERTEIKAPYDAIIASRKISLGTFASKGSEIGQVNSIAEGEVRLPIANNQLSYLPNRGINAQVKLTANIGDEQIEWTATVVRSEGIKDQSSRMHYLIAEVADPYALKSDLTPLEFGSYVEADVTGLTLIDAAVIDSNWVSNNQVAVVDANNQLVFKSLVTVHDAAGNSIVKSGLAEGDNVITSSLQYPVPGMQLVILNENQPAIKESNPESAIALQGE